MPDIGRARRQLDDVSERLKAAWERVGALNPNSQEHENALALALGLQEELEAAEVDLEAELRLQAEFEDLTRGRCGPHCPYCGGNAECPS